MKSVKPGRGPSMLGGIISIAAVAFGVFWTVLAIASGAVFMAPFGIIFVVIAVVQAVYHFKNATGKNRYSQFDITEDGEEEDPLNARYGAGDRATGTVQPSSGKHYCPYCGTPTQPDFEYCTSCGKKLPD